MPTSPGPKAARGDRPPLYGLDIETDTAVDGLDPRVSPVIAAAISTESGDTVLTGSEPDILTGLDEHIASLAPGVLVTWNGSAFDLPFLADRSAACALPLGLHLVPDPSIPRRDPGLPGHPSAYRAVWHGHAHLDAYQLFRWVARFLGVSSSLKSVARLAGLEVVEVDRSAIHRLAARELEHYVASDARLARTLAARRWAAAARLVDTPLAPLGCEVVAKGEVSG